MTIACNRHLVVLVLINCHYERVLERGNLYMQLEIFLKSRKKSCLITLQIASSGFALLAMTDFVRANGMCQKPGCRVSTRFTWTSGSLLPTGHCQLTSDAPLPPHPQTPILLYLLGLGTPDSGLRTAPLNKLFDYVLSHLPAGHEHASKDRPHAK